MGNEFNNAFIAMMRYSEIPRDFSSDSLRFVEITEDQICHNLIDETPSPSSETSSCGPGLPLITDTKHQNYTKPNDTKSKRKNSDGAQYVGTVHSVNGSYYNDSMTDPIPPNKTQSLPINATISGLDSIILSALRVSAEELAGQITLLDFPEFAAIQPDELTSCAWTKKNKHVVAPNIVAFTKRFNHTSFWTVQEILSGSTAEIIAHFIKVAKKLFEFNNLHSLFAIVSAMQTASIFRLSKTWSCLSKKDKQTFDRLADIFNEKYNWANLRKYLESLKLPCIPYLGLFLTDLVYIDLAHPYTSGCGLESEQRRTQMNNILRVISSYQGSNYSHIPNIPTTQKYLQSVRYIEELQNIFEDDQYKKSLKLEPQTVPSSSSCSSKESVVAPQHSGYLDPSSLASLNLSPVKLSGSVRLSATTAAKFIPCHRKSRSLGSNFRSISLPRNFHKKCHCVPAAGSSVPITRCKCSIFGKNHSQVGAIESYDNPLHQSRHLLDDSVIEDKCGAGAVGSADGFIVHQASGDHSLSTPVGFQGCVRRKTMLKDGRKPAVASWQRYWLQIWANSLVYVAPKSFKGTERSDFKREPCKVSSLDGWSAQLMDNTPQMNTFQLINTSLGTVYKFRTGSANMTALWLESLGQDKSDKTQLGNTKKQLPINLMTFE